MASILDFFSLKSFLFFPGRVINRARKPRCGNVVFYIQSMRRTEAADRKPEYGDKDLNGHEDICYYNDYSFQYLITLVKMKLIGEI
jgi:hypothetical protein